MLLDFTIACWGHVGRAESKGSACCIAQAACVVPGLTMPLHCHSQCDSTQLCFVAWRGVTLSRCIQLSGSLSIIQRLQPVRICRKQPAVPVSAMMHTKVSLVRHFQAFPGAIMLLWVMHDFIMMLQVTLHNSALFNIDADPTSGFRKLGHLLQSPPFPPQTFCNILMLYCKPQHASYDLAGTVMAENPDLVATSLSKVTSTGCRMSSRVIAAKAVSLCWLFLLRYCPSAVYASVAATANRGWISNSMNAVGVLLKLGPV